MKYLIPVFVMLASINCVASPIITLDGKKIADFGTFPANRKQSAVFIIKNTGNEDLKITKIRKTCGCSATKLSNDAIQPGQSATLIANIKENSIAGPFSKNIYVESNAENSRFLRLTLSGKAVPLLQIFPKKYLYMGTLTPGKPSSYSFKLKASQANVKLKLMPSKANFSVQTSLRKLNDKEFLLKITATPDKPDQFLNAKVIVNIISPEGWPPIKIKLMGKTTK